MNATVTPISAARPVDITVRKPDFRFAEKATPRLWFDNDPFLSALFTAFSATLPLGERQFIHSVRLFQDRVKHSALLKEVRAFIGQEAHHAKQHDAFNAWMQTLGYNIERIEKRSEKFVEMAQKASEDMQLRDTVCAEHFTALMARYFVKVNPAWAESMDEEARQIWRWHAMEELEHKAVAFDVYAATVNDPGHRKLRAYMVFSTVMMLGFNAWHTYEFLKDSGESRNFRSIGRGLKAMFGRRGMFGSQVREYLDFYRKGFHPWDHDDRAALDAFKKIHFPDMSETA